MIKKYANFISEAGKTIKPKSNKSKKSKNLFDLPYEKMVDLYLREIFYIDEDDDENMQGIYSINSDGSVDVNGDIDISDQSKVTIYDSISGIGSYRTGPYYYDIAGKLPFKFGKITGAFDCSHRHLRTLENSPNEVTGDFNCTNNLIISLKGCPKIIGGDFNFEENQKLQTFEEFPDHIGDILYSGCPVGDVINYIFKEVGITDTDSIENPRFSKMVTEIVKSIILYDVIRRRNDEYCISDYRLSEAVKDIIEMFPMKKPIVTKISGYKFED